PERAPARDRADRHLARLRRRRSHLHRGGVLVAGYRPGHLRRAAERRCARPAGHLPDHVRRRDRAQPHRRPRDHRPRSEGTRNLMAVSSETVAQLLGAERNPLARRLASLGRAVRFIGRRPTGMFGLITIGIAVGMALFGPALAPQNPLSSSSLDFAHRMQGPSSAHWLGTDEWGRDLLSQFLLGARVTLIVGVVAGLAAAGIGAVVGICAGYFGGW